MFKIDALGERVVSSERGRNAFKQHGEPLDGLLEFLTFRDETDVYHLGVAEIRSPFNVVVDGKFINLSGNLHELNELAVLRG